jgi:hypothetical protein
MVDGNFKNGASCQFVADLTIKWPLYNRSSLNRAGCIRANVEVCVIWCWVAGVIMEILQAVERGVWLEACIEARLDYVALKNGNNETQ